MKKSLEEIWLPIKGFEGQYEVSSFGRVRSLNYKHTGQVRVLSQTKDKFGYLQISLYKNGKEKRYLVHRLVAAAFIPNWFDDPQVNHIDEDKTNNNVYNLEWCDSRYNLTYGSRKISNIKKSKKILQLTKTGELVREWPSTMEAGRNGYNKGNIYLCCIGKRQYCKGYIWRYK